MAMIRTCRCRACLDESKVDRQIVNGMDFGYPFMIVCAICGNKRCPHANDHRHECTRSNEPGQKGSAYE